MAEPPDPLRRDRLYEEAVAAFGEALIRLARAYEAQSDRRDDLLQEIHIALWRSLASFTGQCSLRTWVYRVAHNRAISLSIRTRDRRARLLALDDIDPPAVAVDLDRALDEERTQDRVHAAIRSLNPIDREVILLYLEDLDAATIAEITGLSAANVATKVHRIKRSLIERGSP
jgi:RNA polymerase sigma-70 factor (ECF subfamily)